ncbi:hypothetical protein [Antarcticirhabdus aurantiaca]|uniref:Uncharacterized protein n=1 Tax=Antarcticirhabdus aurantiaca TaxID=2606717 RepID=A0ACD4NKG8_9HYPH|nr:hypothetical protein [Antarcticirhabdus aurantiaca]WAJ27151.1 hypothetical protein OXU80_20175 [Jeongeuplla avenae]
MSAPIHPRAPAKPKGTRTAIRRAIRDQFTRWTEEARDVLRSNQMRHLSRRIGGLR